MKKAIGGSKRANEEANMGRAGTLNPRAGSPASSIRIKRATPSQLKRKTNVVQKLEKLVGGDWNQIPEEIPEPAPQLLQCVTEECDKSINYKFSLYISRRKK
ncbi:MAG: hypothetical protein L6243_05310 [Candidatus Altiarchaeales archaeon]|nr:hypothetical protein [Candidatus Altiarchaeales archaeon]